VSILFVNYVTIGRSARISARILSGGFNNRVDGP
jgi:hypothetical protein